MPASPTDRTYASLNAAYVCFNGELFGCQLPPCLITMQRHQGAHGYFSGERFASVADPKEITDEIALNPAHFASRPPAATLSTLGSRGHRTVVRRDRPVPAISRRARGKHGLHQLPALEGPTMIDIPCRCSDE